MKDFVVMIYNIDRTHSIHHVSTLKMAQAIVKEWIKQDFVITATIFTKLIETEGKASLK